MIVPAMLGIKYGQYQETVNLLAQDVKATLHVFCERNGFAFQSRVKTKDSLAEKIEQGRYAAWSEIDDLFACTVIVPSLGHEQSVIELCQTAFEVQRSTLRGSGIKEPDVFRYDSSRLWCRLRVPESTAHPPPPNKYQVTFEVQIRTAFEHAWSVSMHPLVYKSKSVAWNRLRLAAEIKATLEQLDALVMAFDDVAKHVTPGRSPQVKQRMRIADRAKSWLDKGLLPSELEPKDMSRFAENFQRVLSASQVTNESPALGKLERRISDMGSLVVPKSTTLLQLSVAILVEESIVGLPIDGYKMHVTQELVSLFPAFGELEADQKFDYDS